MYELNGNTIIFRLIRNRKICGQTNGKTDEYTNIINKNVTVKLESVNK